MPSCRSRRRCSYSRCSKRGKPHEIVQHLRPLEARQRLLPGAAPASLARWPAPRLQGVRASRRPRVLPRPSESQALVFTPSAHPARRARPVRAARIQRNRPVKRAVAKPAECARCKAEDTYGTHQTVTMPSRFGSPRAVKFCTACWARLALAEPRAARRPRSVRGRRGR